MLPPLEGAACVQGKLVKFVFLAFFGREVELFTVTPAREQSAQVILT